jgi:hypothetical protein
VLVCVMACIRAILVKKGSEVPARGFRYPGYLPENFLGSEAYRHGLTAQGVNPFGPGVHVALQFTYPTSVTGAYPALWYSGEQSQKTLCKRFSSLAGAPWSFQPRSVWTNRCVVHRAEKPESV